MKFPSALSILLIITAVVAVSTWFIPSGNFANLTYNSENEKFIITSTEGTQVLPATTYTLDSLNVKIPLDKFTGGDIYKPINIPGTYHSVEEQPQGFFKFAMAPIKGIINAADIIFLVLIIGGLIGIINLTGAFTAGIAWLAKALKGREYLLIIITTTLVALGGTTFGFAEETLPFYLILVPVFIAAGYDAMVGLASIFLGSVVGTMCSTINPFSTIIASDSAGILWTTGLTGRIIMWVVCVTLSILFILHYAKKVKRDPSASILRKQNEMLKEYFGVNAVREVPALNLRRILILIVFISCFAVMIIGVSLFEWWFIEMTSTFFVGALIIGLIYRINEGKFAEEFIKGAGDLLGVAFIIGIARGISILMDDGMISDTLLYHASSVTEGLHQGVFINTLLFIYSGLSFLIPSSSGMAVLTMPIFAPLADTADLGREIIVNAYLYGMGLFHIINPTGLILPSLAIVKVGYDRWLKFVWPLLVILLVVTMISLTLQVYL
ncbi:YfcC family protein [Salinimicrobium xinjiangense]|uniref:YfcC family protein n=1 Tax=Salinimicrobium xinjiangense TaxID=438596 RepID=UPI00040C341E|nr:YfcC family protein [Salinimicrobium xinjiangense]